MANKKLKSNSKYSYFAIGFVFVFVLIFGYFIFSSKELPEEEIVEEKIQDEVVPNKKIYNVSIKSPEKFSSTMQSSLLEAIKSDDFVFLEKLFENYFDIENAAKIALGRMWYTLDDNSRDEFLSLFTRYISSTYYGYIKEVIRYADDVVVQSIHQVSSDDNTYKGKLVIVRNNEGNITVGFTIKATEDGFKLVDFTAFRISFTMSLRRSLKPYVASGNINNVTNFLEKEIARHQNIRSS